MDNLGLCYYSSERVGGDVAEAAKWFRKAAEFGDAGAMYHLSLCYGSGTGVGKNVVEAIKWCRRAAAKGDADAKAMLEGLYD